MGTLRILSPAEQVAARLREDLAAGVWQGTMPGVLRLEAEMGVNRKAVEAGLRLLEHEGLVEGMGPGKRRRILSPLQSRAKGTSLRIAILANEPLALGEAYMVEMLHLLLEAGHQAFFAPKCLTQLGKDFRRVARLVRETPADAWVVRSAPQEVLEWFIKQGIPAFALFGRRRDLPIASAGPDKVSAFRMVVRQLVGQGHRRIVLLVRKERRLPHPGMPERAFIEELQAHGIATTSFNLPDWEESADGVMEVVDSLFKVTPPTALFIDEAYLFHAVKHHLAALGLKVPKDVSMVSTDPDHTFDWCRPSIAHVSWDSAPLIRRIIRWARNVGQGKVDIRQVESPAVFVPGGTMGPAKVWP